MLFGVALGLAAHEAGHVAANALYGSDMFVKKVDTVGIPFFAIAHRKQLLPRQEVVVASAGLWVQSALSEWVLTRAPRLRHRSAPIRKGVIGFHAVTSALYGVAGLAGVGPPSPTQMKPPFEKILQKPGMVSPQPWSPGTQSS